jgi:Skp family chaperone for outer membrane proteins
MKRSRFRAVCPSLLLAGLLFTSSAIASGSELQAILESWVETRREIAEEENRWREEQAQLHRTRELLENELQRLEADTERLAHETADQGRERERLAAETQAQEAILDAIAERTETLEASLAAYHARFPDPLRERTGPLRNRLLQEAERPPPAQRAQTVVALLGEADRFQTSLHPAREVLVLPEGETREVRTLYLGLGQAFYLSSDGHRAGTGRPGENGWEWASRPDLAGEIRRLFSVYDNEIAPDFVRLPVTLGNR